MTKERFFKIAEEEGLGFDAQGLWDARPAKYQGTETPDISEDSARGAFKVMTAEYPDLVALAKEEVCRNNTEQQ
jgi:hypothetical protein